MEIVINILSVIGAITVLGAAGVAFLVIINLGRGGW